MEKKSLCAAKQTNKFPPQQSDTTTISSVWRGLGFGGSFEFCTRELQTGGSFGFSRSRAQLWWVVRTPHSRACV